jgi:hypothetical protein
MFRRCRWKPFKCILLNLRMDFTEDAQKRNVDHWLENYHHAQHILSPPPPITPPPASPSRSPSMYSSRGNPPCYSPGMSGVLAGGEPCYSPGRSGVLAGGQSCYSPGRSVVCAGGESRPRRTDSVTSTWTCLSLDSRGKEDDDIYFSGRSR